MGDSRTVRKFYIYMLASHRNGTLYIGMTNDLLRRVSEHKSGLVEGFTKKYGVQMLVWCEVAESASSAIQREKQLKRWRRNWKLRLIEESNPEWRDLFDDFGCWEG